MSGYDQHVENNVKTVNKLIKAKIKESEADKNSQVRAVRSPRSLQAGPFGARANSLVQSEALPIFAKPKVSVSKKNEEAINKEKERAEVRELRKKINAQKVQERIAKKAEERLRTQENVKSPIKAI